MFDRDKMKKKKLASKVKTNENWERYKALRNKVNSAIKKPKASYFNLFFKDNCRNIKNTWKGINSILGKTPQPTKIDSLKIGDTTHTSANEISDALNQHFCSVGLILANEMRVVQYSSLVRVEKVPFRLVQVGRFRNLLF